MSTPINPQFPPHRLADAEVAHGGQAGPDIAKRVDDLVRDDAVMEWFHAKIIEFSVAKQHYQECCQAADLEFQENCLATLENERLQNENAGPPGEGWKWHEGLFDEPCADDAGVPRDKEIQINGWFPPPKVVIPKKPLALGPRRCL